MSTEPTRPTPTSSGRWWLPVLLVLIILGIIAGAYFATHPHLFGSSPTSTPTPTLTATPTRTPAVTATPKPGPTGTPVPGPTGTPAPGPTATPQPGPSPTATSGVRTGAISHPQAQILNIQRRANQKNPSYTFYLQPFQVVQHNLTAYGFKSGYTIVSPTPEPTATPYTNPQGLPETQITVQYSGKRYLVILEQPVQKGPSGIWVITTIKAM